MDDVIYRQDSVNELREYITEPSISDDESEIIGYNDGIELAISVLSTMPSAQQWIPCSERLPENDFTDVLICVHDKRKGCENDFYVIQAYTVGKHWEPTLHVDMTDLYVDAWMPLPSPYREEVSD